MLCTLAHRTQSPFEVFIDFVFLYIEGAELHCTRMHRIDSVYERQKIHKALNRGDHFDHAAGYPPRNPISFS